MNYDKHYSSYYACTVLELISNVIHTAHMYVMFLDPVYVQRSQSMLMPVMAILEMFLLICFIENTTGYPGGKHTTSH